MNTNQRRDDSRLELDDKYYCKRCGWELPEICVDDEWHPLGGEDSPEYCGKCLFGVAFR